MSRQPRVALLVCALLCASAARAEPSPSPADASEHFQRGLTHAKAGELGLATREFEQAYASSPHYSVLYNLGQAYTALGRSAEAISAFERYLRDGATNVDNTRREQVRGLLELNRRRLLEAGPTKPTAAPRPGQLAATCEVPDAQVSLDGVLQGTVPLAAPLIATSGKHEVSFHRAGYTQAPSSVTLRAGVLASVQCELIPQAPLAAEQQAWLRFALEPADAQVMVDGRRFSAGLLPAGKHTVVVSRRGYISHQREVVLAVGRTLTLAARLAFSAEQRRWRAHVAARRSAGWALAGVGGLSLATGTTLQIYNAHQYDDWSARKAHATESQNLTSASSIQRVDDLSIGLLLAGAGLLATGVWLVWPTPPPQFD